MNNNKVQNQNENEEYLSMVNYLISQLNKAKVNAFPVKNQSTSLPIFLYEFFVFELYLPSELLKFIKQPILAFRLLDFPSLTLEGSLNYQRQSIIFNQGKSSYFEMDLLDLKDNLLNQPMYIMFLDLNHGNIKVIGNCRLNVSLFTYDSFLNYGKGPIPEPRRNILQLFDNTMEKIGEFEMTLLIRREYYKFDKNIEIKENTKSVVIKKAKKKKPNLIRDKNESLMYKGQSPKKQKTIIYDNNKISNSKYTQPQFINNIILEKKDKAFNAHPVNKEIIIKPKKEEEEKYPEDFQDKPKNKKSKVMKKNAQTETDLIPGVDVPINKVDYNKENKIMKKKEKKKNNNINNKKNNNQMLINSMYNKYQADYNYNLPQYEIVPINNFNNNTNNFNNTNSNEFKNYYNNQNNINNNFSKKESPKNENNSYLQFLTDLKSKVNNYTNNLLNDQKVLQKIKEERNLNHENILNNIQSNPNTNNNNNIDNINIIDNNNQNEEIQKQELDKKSEKEENLKKSDDNSDEDNQIKNNNNNNNKNNIKELNQSNMQIKEEDEYNDFEISDKSKEKNDNKESNNILDNKFNNFDNDIEIKNENDIQENIVRNNSENNINKSSNRIQSDNDIKEDNSLIEKNKNKKIGEDSNEINEEIEENIASIPKENKIVNSEEINSGTENKGLASSSTENIEKLLK